MTMPNTNIPASAPPVSHAVRRTGLPGKVGLQSEARRAEPDARGGAQRGCAHVPASASPVRKVVRKFGLTRKVGLQSEARCAEFDAHGGPERGCVHFSASPSPVRKVVRKFGLTRKVGLQSETCRAEQSGIFSQLRQLDAHRGTREGLRPLSHFAPDGLQEQISSLHQASSQHYDLGIQHAYQVGNPHSQVFGCPGHREASRPIVAARALDGLFGSGGSRIPRHRGTGRLAFPAAHLPVDFLLLRIQREPSNRAGDAFGALDQTAAGENARADSGSHRYEDHVAEAARGAQPLLAQYVGGAVAVHHHRPRELRLQVLAQRNMIPAGQFGAQTLPVLG